MANKKLKTGELPNMPNRKAIKEIEELIEDYVVKRDTRMAASKPEAEAKQLLIGALKKHKLAEYEFDDTDGIHFEAKITVEKEKLKVKKAKADAEEEE
jgi:hypothetical protein